MPANDCRGPGPYLGAWGPATRFRLARLAAVYAGLFGTGLLLVQTAAAPGWRAFGLGLMLPGGGLLARTGSGPVESALHIALTLGTFVGFGLGLFIWFATGNVMVAPLVWLAAALAALAMNHPAICGPSGEAGAFLWLPGGIAGFILLGTLGAAVLRTSGKRAGRRNARDVAAQRPAQVERLKAAARAPGPAELSQAELARLRFLLDRALQPIDAFEGFQWIEQFQTSAVRYQLCFAGYALAFAQARYLPAFRGYLARAQHNLIDKQRDHRVWRYWRRENLWGNLRAGADPVPRDNIMYAGFVAAQIAYYQAASGDLRFSEPGAFALRHPDGRTFAHDFHGLIAALKAGWRRSPYLLMACEPNWVYPLCNGIGATAVMAHDRQFGRAAWPAIAPRFRAALHRELTTPAGRLVPFRSTYTGIAAPQIGGAVAEAFPCVFYGAALPEEALRLWILARRDMLTAEGALKTRRFWTIDTGDYRFSRATSYAGVAAAAVQMGDKEVAELALAALEAACPGRSHGGVIHREKASVWAHAVELMARFGSAEGLARLLDRPPAATPGPVIDTEAYPDCLVAAAHWQDRSLRAVLYPGRGDGTFVLPLAGFAPGAAFRCEGCASGSGRADAEGRAKIAVRLAGRSELRVRF
ncbi:MAG: hypothetical protein QNJ30_09565 [Kiloniellales bacterium]|nr:hypothetical protein [Kiloniellales bacterium]